MENPSLTIKQLIFISVFFIYYWFVFCQAHCYRTVCLSITCSLPCLGSLVSSSYQRTEIAAVLAVSFSFSIGDAHYLAMSIFKCKWPSKLGQSFFLESLLSHHLCVFLFKADLLSPICISSSVLFDNLFQLRKGASKLCIAHFVKVIIDDNSGIKRLILFCRCFYQIEDKSWFPILFLCCTSGANRGHK